MAFKSDIEIAQEAKLEHIKDVAAKIGLTEDDLEYYGRYKAKIDYNLLERYKDKQDAKLILTTAINPTPAGEGKTTTTVGLGDALRKLGKNAMIARREPSLGPVFGVKGGAAGRLCPGSSHGRHKPSFYGDFHAIGAANNLLAAMVDNHIYQEMS